MSIESVTADPAAARTWTIVDGHYPGFRELRGASFKVSVVMSATDISFDQALQREADLALMAAAPDLLDALKSLSKRLYECRDLSVFEAYDSFYSEIVDQAIAKAEGRS